MTTDSRRIRAVAASLRGIRTRVMDADDEPDWNTAPFNNTVSLLGDAVEGLDFSNHLLDDEVLGRTDYLVHLESLIAFLEAYEKEGESGGSVLNLFPRHQS